MNTESVRKLWDDLRGHGRMRRAAWRLLHARKFVSASEIIELGRKRFPGSISFEILHARYFLLADNREIAAVSLNKIEKLSTQDVFDQFELAETFRLMGNYTEAIGLYENVIKNGKLNLPLLASQRLSSIYYRLEQPDNALAATVNCIRLGGDQRIQLMLQLGRDCTSKSVEKAIAEIQAVRISGFGNEAKRLKLIAFLATTIDRWELAIESVGQATKHRFLMENDAELWDDSQPPLRPSVLIIGAMKSGTTALFKQLAAHPQFVTPLNKELHFFFNGDWPDEFYFQQFPKVATQTAPFLTGEASPGYYALDIVDRVKRMMPETNIAFIKRDPVDRAVSHLFHNRNAFIQEHPIGALTKGMEIVLDMISLDHESLRAALRDLEMERKVTNRYLLLGCYELLMRRWKAAYGPEQILELDFSEFTSETQKTMDQVFQFIGLAPHKINESSVSNSGSYKDDSAELINIKSQLADFYSRVNHWQ